MITTSTPVSQALRNGLNFMLIAKASYAALMQYTTKPKTRHDLQQRIIYTIARILNQSVYKFATLKNTIIWKIGESYVVCPYLPNMVLSPEDLPTETAKIFLSIRYMDFINVPKISNVLEEQCKHIIAVAYNDNPNLIYYGEKDNLHLFKTHDNVEYIIENTALSGGRIHIYRSTYYA